MSRRSRIYNYMKLLDYKQLWLIGGACLLWICSLPKSPRNEGSIVVEPIEINESISQKRLLTGNRVNLNEATATELTSLPGIGPSLAEKIVRTREKEGPFVAVDSLARIKGIGTKKLEKIKPWVIVTNPAHR